MLDLNVILDVLLDRAPHADTAAAVWALLESGRAEGRIAAHSVTTLAYLVTRAQGRTSAEAHLHDILAVFRASPVDQDVLRRALALSFADFEDAVTAAAAEADGCDLIVSRNAKDFRRAPLPVLTPEAARAAMEATTR